MPYYDLKCDKCGNEFNKKASMAEKENKKILCPECGSNDLNSIFKNINIVKSTKSAPACPTGGCCGGSCGI